MKQKIILDLTTRLPGPLATYLLADLGYKIVKVEWEEFPDAFNLRDPVFSNWYKVLNKNKLIVKIRRDDPAEIKKIKKYLLKSEAVIVGLPPQIRQRLKLEKLIHSHPGSLAVVNLQAFTSSQKSNKPLHDLNALALSGLLKSHIEQFNEREKIPPPFLPLAGITYGQNLCIQLLQLLIKSKNDGKTHIKNYSLEESLNTLARPFLVDNLLGPHNGQLPCYHIYPIKKKNCYMALALMEKKYWNGFIEASGIALSPEDHLKSDRRIFQKLQNYFKNLTFLEAGILCSKTECISLIRVE